MTNPYKQVQNETATPLDLWDRGYRRCVALLQGAKRAIAQGDPASQMNKAKFLSDTFAIVEFWNAALPPATDENLDFPGLSSRLRKAYDFLLRQIVSANAENSLSDIDEALRMLQHLHEVFHQNDRLSA